MANMVATFLAGLSEKEKKVLYIALVIVVMALFDRLIIGPISGEADRLDEKIESQKTLIQKNLLILQYKGKILRENEAFIPYYTDKKLTQEERIALFLKEIETLAKSSQVVLSNINPVETEDKDDYKIFKLTVECTGLMDQMVDFIYGIDNSKKPISVYSLNLSAKNREKYEVKAMLTIQKLILTPGDTLELADKLLKKEGKSDAVLPDEPVASIKITDNAE